MKKKEKKSKKKLFLVAGRTAAGKSTIVRSVCEKHGLKQVVSYATRPIRYGETEGLDHLFIKPEDVDKYIDDMAAYTKIGDFEYFATYNIIDQATFYVIDPIGIQDMIQTCGDRYDLIVIYINSNYETREHRAILTRNDNYLVFEKRVQAEDAQFSDFEERRGWDYVICNNGNFNYAVKQMEAILTKEGVL